MSRPSSSTVKTVLVLLSALALVRALRLPERGTTLRRHVELLQKVTPIHQFAPVAGSRALFDRDGHFGVTVVAHRHGTSEPWTLVPIDERELAGWLA
ncbi:MAG: hypothetical protein JHD16_16365 [Solirubrobacteraceae bacterium]|nr:hypothetical protein [Solirubrobacteraceae bacterium]